MQHVGSRGDTAGSAESSIEPVVSALRVVEGTPLDDAAPYATTSTIPPKATRGRESENLFILFNLSDSASPHLCRKLREITLQTYWSTSGSVTAALRRAAGAVNRHLFKDNLNSKPSERCYSGFTCAVLHDDDLYMLQAGRGWACFLREGHLTRFPRSEDELAYLGIGPLADVRLCHVFTSLNDTLLLASPALARKADDENLARVLLRAEMERVLADLRQVAAGVDFTALVVRWRKALVEETSMTGQSARARPSAAPVETLELPERQSRPPESHQERVRWIRGLWKAGRRLGLTLDKGLRDAVRGLGHAFKYIARGAAAAGRGLAILGKRLAGAMGAVFWSMLPGTRELSHDRARRRAPPEEKRTLMMAIAIAVPLLVATIVAVAYLRFGTKSRLQGILKEAEEEVASAQAAGVDREDARAHWEAALALAATAVGLQSDASSAREIQEQAQNALDRLDQVKRLAPIQLVDFGSSNKARRLVVHNQLVFVLDPMNGWVARVLLNQAGDGMAREGVPVLAHTGEQIEGDSVGELIDFIWVGQGSGRRRRALLILEEDGALLSHNPAWESEGEPYLRRSFLGAPPPGKPKAVDSFEGRFYVLDTTADGNGQIWRYVPQDDTYPTRPERYFTDPPSKSLTGAVDMAIDGNIYVLYADGTIVKFLRGARESFHVRDVPGGLGQVTAFAVDPGGSGAIYVVDRGKDRVVKLGPEGRFKAQFRARGAFDALESLAVNETAKRLYVLNGGRLYVAPLPESVSR